MKKFIPFNLAKALAGAKVVTNTGQEVKILTYDGRDSERPIIGTFMHAAYEEGRGYGKAEEILDRWPVDGKNTVPGGYDLMLEEEEIDFFPKRNADRMLSLTQILKAQAKAEISSLKKKNEELSEELEIAQRKLSALAMARRAWHDALNLLDDVA